MLHKFGNNFIQELYLVCLYKVLQLGADVLKICMS